MYRTGLPHFTKGTVVKGFGRGSKELGCPTANFPVEVVNNLPPEVETGVYFGFAQVNKGPVYEMVMSIGWNPFYQNNTKSMETHILHKFDDDFYSQELKVIIVGYIRAEKNFDSLNELIETINDDIAKARVELQKSDCVKYKDHSFFTEKTVSSIQ